MTRFHPLPSTTRRQRRGANAAGFTLIEVLVAIVIVAALTAALMSCLNTAFKARRVAATGIASSRSKRVVMDIIGRDIESTLPPTGILAASFEGADGQSTWNTDGDTLTLSNTADPTSLVDAAGDNEQVTLALVSDTDVQTATPSSNSNSNSNSSSGLSTPQLPAPKIIGPALVPSSATSGDEGVLVRRVQRQLLAPVAPSPVDEVICRHVRSFNLRYYDGTEWLDSWDSTTENNALPLAVEVTLVVADPGPSSGQATATTTVRVFRIPGADPSAAAVTGGTGTTP